MDNTKTSDRNHSYQQDGFRSNGKLLSPEALLSVAKNYPTAAEAALAYKEAGINPVPLLGKNANINGGGWQNKRYAPEDIPKVFSNGYNVGALLGTASGGLVDIDKDHPLSVPTGEVIIPRVLGNTISFGRNGNRNSHTLCLCDPLPEKNKKLSLSRNVCDDLQIDPEKATIVEVRVSGQTMFPPSIHPDDKDTCEWILPANTPVVTTGDRVVLAARMIATASLLALYSREGFRQDLALAVAGFLLRKNVPEEDVKTIVEAYCNAIEDEEEEKRLRAVEDTLKKLVEGGEATGGPRLAELTGDAALKLIYKWWGFKRESGSGQALGEKPHVPTHDELGDRWIKEYEPVTAYTVGKYRRYFEGIWKEIEEPTIESEVWKILKKAKGEGLRPTKHIHSSIISYIRAMIAVSQDVWNANPDILVCRNGTLDIPTRTRREHRPEDYSTSGVPYAYDPKAKCPNWDYLLNSTVPDAANFLQEFAGLCLTTENSKYEIATWLYGPEGSGKSTFIEGILAVLGEDRSGELSLATLNNSQFALSRIEGKTLLFATEQPSEYLKCINDITTLISGERIGIEEKYKPRYEIRPTAKILWAMNDLPRVSGVNHGLFRRIKVVEFPPIPEDERDPTLKEKIKEEAPGILNWMLEGLDRLNERGHFEIPQCVKDSTEEYRRNSDIPRMFVEEVLEESRDGAIKASKLYSIYRAWCQQNGHLHKSSTGVAKDWQRLGFVKAKRKDGTYYLGYAHRTGFFDDPLYQDPVYQEAF